MRRLPTFKNKYECCNHLDFSSPHTQYVFFNSVDLGHFFLHWCAQEDQVLFVLSAGPPQHQPQDDLCCPTEPQTVKGLFPRL